MRSLFNISGSTGNPRVFNELKNIRLGIDRNLSKVMRFNEKNLQPLISEDPITKLLYSLPGSGDRTDRYWMFVNEQMYSLTSGVGITNEINNGRLFRGDESYYGEAIDTVIIGYNTNPPTFNTQGRLLKWREQTPLEVLHYPGRDLGLQTPNGVYTTSEYGVAVLSLDVALLAAMFLEWKLENMELPPGERQSVGQFVQLYVLNGLIPTQLDCAIFNRQLDQLLRKEGNMDVVRSTTPIVDYATKLDTELKEDVVPWLRSKDVTVAEILTNVPLSQGHVLLDIIPTLPVAPTRAVYWALLLTYAPYVEYVASVLLMNGSQVNKDFQKRLKRELRIIKTDKLVQAAPNRDVVDYLTGQMETLAILADG